MLLIILHRRLVPVFIHLFGRVPSFALLLTLLASQGHAPVPCNPPQPEDADILEEPGASAADDAAPAVDAEIVLVETGDSEDSSPFRVKRSRPLSAEDHAALDDDVLPAAPFAGPSPSAATPAAPPKRVRLGRLVRPRAARVG